MNIKCIYGIQVQKYNTTESVCVCLMNNVLLSLSLRPISQHSEPVLRKVVWVASCVAIMLSMGYHPVLMIILIIK